jgi:hypothetical protein
MIGVRINELRLSKRIAHEGYPPCEALYGSIREYEEFTQTKLLHSFCDNCGYANGNCPACERAEQAREEWYGVAE